LVSILIAAWRNLLIRIENWIEKILFSEQIGIDSWIEKILFSEQISPPFESAFSIKNCAGVRNDDVINLKTLAPQSILNRRLIGLFHNKKNLH
jgi:hypothetical protein